MGRMSRDAANGTEEDSRKKARASEVDDKEVEEFFEVLQRLKEAKRLLSSQQREGSVKVENDSSKESWMPTFEWVDFKSPVIDGEKREETRRLLDLNVDPKIVDE